MMEHFYQNIREGAFDFQEVYARAVRGAKDPAHFVEVGAWTGASAAFMAVEIINARKAIAFDVVDLWEQVDPLAADLPHAVTLAEFENNVAPARAGIRHVHQMASVDAAKLYADRSLDFVFIDADHSYESIMADIAAWHRKVKGGGVIGGHDFVPYYSGVIRAVREVFGHRPAIVGTSWVVTVVA